MKTKKIGSNIAMLTTFLLVIVFCVIPGNGIQAQETDNSARKAKLEEFKQDILSREGVPADLKEAAIAEIEKNLQEEPDISKLFSSKPPSREDIAKLNEFQKYYRFGSVKVSLDSVSEKKSFQVGESAKFIANLENLNPYPIFSAQLYIQVLRENTEGQEENGDHLVDSFLAVDDISIDAGQKQAKEFIWKVPAGLAVGEFKLAAFILVGKKYNINGLPFAENVYAATFPIVINSPHTGQIQIDRNNVLLNGEKISLRSATPMLKQEEKAKIEFPIVNNSGKKEEVEVVYDLYYWDSSNEANKQFSKKEKIVLNSGEKKMLLFEKSDVLYPIDFLVVKAETADGQKTMLKFRWSNGEAVPRVRINFPGITKFPLARGSDYDIFASYHIGSNVIGEVKTKIEIALFDRDGELIETLKADNPPTSMNILNLSKTATAKKDLDWVKLVAKVTDDKGIVIDEGIVIYDAEQLSANSPSIIAKQNAVKRKNMIKITMGILLVLIISILAIIFLKKKGIIRIFLVSMIVFSIGILKSADKIWAHQDSTFIEMNDIPWPNNNTSNPQMTVGAWQMAFMAQPPHSSVVSIFAYLTMNYQISVEKIGVGLIEDNNINMDIGESIKFTLKKNGEHFMNGGSFGTPSVTWVDWNPNEDLFSPETKERFASIGDGPVQEVFKNKNRVASVIVTTPQNFYYDLHALVAIQNPVLSVSTSSGSLICDPQEDKKDRDGMYTGESTIICRAIDIGAGSLNFTVGAANFQESVTWYLLGGSPHRYFACHDNEVPDPRETCCRVRGGCENSLLARWIKDYYRIDCGHCVSKTEPYPCSLVYRAFNPDYNNEPGYHHHIENVEMLPLFKCDENNGGGIAPYDIDFKMAKQTCTEWVTIGTETFCAFWDTIKNDYLTIPPYTKTWNLNVSDSSNHPPTPPYCDGCPSTLDLNQNGTFNIGGSTDPDGDQVKYEVDWDMNGTADISSPLGASNGSFFHSFSKSWNNSGNKTFQFRAIDSNFRASGWVNHSVNVNCASLPGCATVPDLCINNPPSGCSSLGSPCVTGSSCNNLTISDSNVNWICSNSCGQVSCSQQMFSPEDGACGTANGTSICDGRRLMPRELCDKGIPDPFNPDTSGYEVRWQCIDSNNCGGTPASCFARGKKSCGWIEVNP